jgi:hypothetical protein
MAGSPHTTLRIFRRFYTEDAAWNVIFTTTMWNVLKSEDVGARREQLLKDRYWRAMLDKGASFGRFDGTHASAWDIIDLVLCVFSCLISQVVLTFTSAEANALTARRDPPI